MCVDITPVIYYISCTLNTVIDEYNRCMTHDTEYKEYIIYNI